VDITGTVNYTSTAILLPPGTADDPNRFSLSGHRFGSNSVNWANYPISGLPDGVYSSFYVDPTDKKRHRAWLDGTTTLGGKTTWVIATVPEPPAILSAGVGFACVVLCVKLGHRRRPRGMVRSDPLGVT
jgi:hypothetical protein